MPTIPDLVAPLKVVIREVIVSIRDEDLAPTSALPATVFQARHKNWRSFPVTQVRTIDSLAGETLLFTPADYSIDSANGAVTLVTATSDIVRATYDYNAFTDDELEDQLESARAEIENAVGRTISSPFHESYSQAIVKRAYTNLLKTLQAEARDFFSVSIAGRSVDKNQVVDHFIKIIEGNEEQLSTELNGLRYYNRSKRLE